MEFLAQYDDISDGEDEAELQTQQVVSKVVQQQITHSDHSGKDERDIVSAPVVVAEQIESDDKSSGESSSEDEDEVSTVQINTLPGVLSDLHYAALASGLYEPEPPAAVDRDPHEIYIDGTDESIPLQNANQEPCKPVDDDSSSDTSSDLSDVDDPEPVQEDGNGAALAVSLTEEELQSGVALEEAPRTKHEVEPELSVVEVEISGETPIVIAGHIMYRMDHECTAVVKAEQTDTPLDQGSVLCFDDRSVFGQVYETFGPVTQPFYVTRWHPSQPPSKDFSAGSTVYIPQEHAVLVTPSELVDKGCDASNVYDEELPVHEQDFSDDEQEAATKAKKKKRTRAQTKGKQVETQERTQPEISRKNLSFVQHQPPPTHFQRQQQGPAQAQQYPSHPSVFMTTAPAHSLAASIPAQPPRPFSAPPPQMYQFTPSPMHLTSQASFQQQHYAPHVAQPHLYNPQQQQGMYYYSSTSMPQYQHQQGLSAPIPPPIPPPPQQQYQTPYHYYPPR